MAHAGLGQERANSVSSGPIVNKACFQRSRGLRGAFVLTGIAIFVSPLGAQQRVPSGIDLGVVFAGSEGEEYLRSLQVAGAAPLYPWSLRGLAAPEVAAMLPDSQAHPWAARFPRTEEGAAPRRLGVLPPLAEVRYNSGFPYGSNDAALWAGRGVSAAVTAGVAGRYGPVSYVLAPTAVWSQNAEFPLQPNGTAEPFADGRSPSSIDLPQRFGEGAYARLDPGQSTLRVDARGVAVGASTAGQVWGPASHYPLVLGNNAPGFPHLFAGTSRPVGVGVGKLHARIVWGRLSQSAYSPVAADSSLRFMSGLVATFTPRGLPGLEVGVSRFYHLPWTDGGPGFRAFLRPVESIFKIETADPDDLQPATEANQLASFFARYVAPRSGFEVYGEYGREDHNFDLRDFILEPDHMSAYTLGFRKVWRRGRPEWVVLRGEVANTQATHLARVRHQGPYYAHHALRQGHTHAGQLLVPTAAYGGGGATLGVDYLHPRGRWTVSWARELRAYAAPDTAVAGSRDVMHSLGGEAVFFRRGVDLTAGVTGVYNRNRYFVSDELNLNLAFGARIGF